MRTVRLLLLTLALLACASAAQATQITVSQNDFPGWANSETAPRLRIFLNKAVVTSDSRTLPSGSPQNGIFYQSITCSIVAGALRVPQFTIDSLPDALVGQDAKYAAYLYRANGQQIGTAPLSGFGSFTVPAIPTTTTWAAILTYNSTTVPHVDNLTYNRTQIDAKIAGIPGVSAITTLSGDGTATGPGPAVFTLANSGVTAGTCTNCDLTIDAKGRVTSKATGTGGGSAPAGAGSEIQARLNGTTVQALTGSSISGANLTLGGNQTFSAATGSVIGFKDKGGQVFNVLSYGAVGNGTTDDLAALQAANTAAAAAKGVVYLPAGTYAVSAPWRISASVIVDGAGWDATKLKARTGFAPDALNALLVVDSVDRAIVRNVGFVSNSIGTVAVSINNSTDSLVTNCRMDSGFTWGVLITSHSRSITVDHCLIDGTSTSNGIEINNSSYCTLSFNHIKNTTANGIEVFLDTTIGSIGEEVGNRLIGNYIEASSGAGIALVGDRNTVISGGVIKSSVSVGLTADLQTISAVNYKSTGGSITGVAFINNGGTTLPAITLTAGSEGWAIIGGSISGSGSNGINLAGTGHSVSGVSIFENRTSGILITSGVHSITGGSIENNSVSGSGNGNGIDLQGSDCTVTGVRITDTRTPKLQAYGILVSGARNTLAGNALAGNLTTAVFDSGTDTFILDKLASTMFVSSAASATPVIIKGAVSQAQDLFRIENTGGSIMAAFSQIGALLMRPGSSGTAIDLADSATGNRRFAVGDTGNTFWTINGVTQSSPLLSFQSTTSGGATESITFQNVRASGSVGAYEGQWRDSGATYLFGLATNGLKAGSSGTQITNSTGTLRFAALDITGTPTGSKFVRDDGSFQSIPGGGDALVANPLSQFAATTSAQLRNVLSDEKGTGVALFDSATSATFITPILGTPTSVTLTNGTGLPPTTGIVGWPSNAVGVLTNNGSGTLTWGAAGSGTVSVVSAGTLASTALVTGGGSQTVQTVSATTTLDSSGNIVTPGAITTGSGGSLAGSIEIGQGTAPSAGANSVKIFGPASITSYILKLPGAAATGIGHYSNSSGVVTMSISAVDLASADVTGDLAYANLVPATAASKLVGRGSASGAGDLQEITIGTGLAMTSTTLSTSSTVTFTIASGTSALGTSAIASGACASVVTTSATGTATTDVISGTFNADPTGVTGYVPSANGMLTIIGYPTTNNVNWKVCNNTASSITPGAITLNWRVAR